MGLVGERALNVNVDGNLNAGAISVLTERVRAEGDTTLKLQARGTVEQPDLTGTFTLRDATAVSDEPNIAAENLNADITLEGSRIVLTKLTGDVNGGTIEGSGSVTLGEGGIADIDMRFATKDFAYDAPLDMRSLSDSEIRIAREDENFVVSGRVTIMEAGLTGDVNFDTGLLAAMTARRKLDLTEERDSFLERLRFNVNVNTATPILVDNNLARAEARARLRVVGTPYEPGLTGQMTLLQGGEVRLNERRYEVERGVITFVDERRIFPSFDLLLNTSAGNYDINIAVTGTPGDTQTTLTSEPALPEPDIMSMLVTGRTLDAMRGEEFEVAQEQALSYLAGRVGNTLGRGLQEATGLSEVRIEPTLIASEADPSARLTLGQELTDELKLVYSTDLTNSNDQIWMAEYDVTRRFQTRGVRQSDASYRLDFQHDVRFGGQASPRRQLRERPKVASVTVVARDTGEEDPLVRDEFDVKEGHTYDFFAIREEVSEVEADLMALGYMQNRIRLERQVEGDKANLTLRVRRGPVVEMRFEGVTPPQKVQDEVRTQWHRGVFDKQRADDGAEALREWLMIDGYLQPKVDYTIDDSTPDRRRVIVSGRSRASTTTRWCWRSTARPASIPTSSTRSSISRSSSDSCSPIRSSSPSSSSAITATRAISPLRSTSRASSIRARSRGSCSRSGKARSSPSVAWRCPGNKVLSAEALLPQLPVVSGGAVPAERRRASPRQDSDAVLAARLQRHAIRLLPGHRSVRPVRSM